MSRVGETLTYPDAPGFKVSGPSEQAAEAISGTANKMRAAVLRQFATYRVQERLANYARPGPLPGHVIGSKPGPDSKGGVIEDSLSISLGNCQNLPLPEMGK